MVIQYGASGPEIGKYGQLLRPPVHNRTPIVSVCVY